MEEQVLNRNKKEMTDWYLCSPTVKDYLKPGKPSHPADCSFSNSTLNTYFLGYGLHSLPLLTPTLDLCVCPNLTL